MTVISRARAYAICLLGLFGGADLSAADNPSASTDGTMRVPAFDMPLSIYMSDEAKWMYIDRLAHPFDIDPSAPIAEYRAVMDRKYFGPRLAKAREMYAVTVESRQIGGVPTQIVVPKNGVSMRNSRRVLINLHGGGFRIGAGMGGLLESVPLAAEGRIKVITVDYRQGPEHKFPAASEDVAAVYREVLKEYPAESIGIYGCSAGGMLTAMAVAWFQKHALPRPGAIGIFCSAASIVSGGDSAFITPALDSFRPSAPPPARPNPPPMPMAYLSDVNPADPLVSPVESDAVLGKFPPTLLMAGGRGDEASSVTHTHNRLARLGVPSQMHLWDGLWHGFLYEVTLPEAREAYDVATKFFDQHLR